MVETTFEKAFEIWKKGDRRRTKQDFIKALLKIDKNTVFQKQWNPDGSLLLTWPKFRCADIRMTATEDLELFKSFEMQRAMEKS